ncbi:MAG: glycoside hydrolase family 105 protein [Lachnospiraceae bacterium]
MWLEYFKKYLEVDFPKFLSEKAWNYKNDLCMIGAADLAAATGDTRWNQSILDAGKWLISDTGKLANWKEGENNIDKISFGKSLMLLYDLTGDDIYLAAVQQVYSMLANYPRTSTGNFWHKDIYPNQVWLDGLYMAMPFYAKYCSDTGIDYWDDIIDQFKSAHELLWNDQTGLYLHGCDVSKTMDWADPVSGQNDATWLRAEGWYLMALTDVYELAAKHSNRAKELIPLLKNALDGLLPYQDSNTKMFFQVPNIPSLSGNYPETSGSGMIAYALMKGARLNMLPEEYWEKGCQVLTGIRDTYLMEEDGVYHLQGICASAGLGIGPDPHNRKDRTGKAEYYISESQMTDNQHGSASCMMAYSEQLRR